MTGPESAGSNLIDAIEAVRQGRGTPLQQKAAMEFADDVIHGEAPARPVLSEEEAKRLERIAGRLESGWPNTEELHRDIAALRTLAAKSDQALEANQGLGAQGHPRAHTQRR